MNSNFLFPYVGRKKKFENEICNKLIKGYDIKTIVEPFGGSFSFSQYLYNRDIDDDMKYVYNDTQPELYELFKKINTEGFEYATELYNYSNAYVPTLEKIQKHKKFIYDDIKDYFAAMCHGDSGRYRHPKQRDINKYKKHIQFIQNIDEITNNDYKQVIDKYKNDPNVLIYLDPPYFDSNNGEYYGQMIKKEDSTSILVDIIDIFKDPNTKCKLMYVHNKNALMNYLFKDFKVTDYSKIYQASKKTVIHSIHTNF